MESAVESQRLIYEKVTSSLIRPGCFDWSCLRVRFVIKKKLILTFELTHTFNQRMADDVSYLAKVILLTGC